MSITDELRNYTEEQIKWLDMTKVHYRKLLAIADRIDAEHRSALEKLAAQLDETSDMREFCGRIEQAAANREDVTLWGVDYVALPVDADGEPIHIGDVMENIVCPSVHREVTGVGAECFYGWDDGNGRYSQFDVNRYRHHHEPTVEDVLREFTDEVWNRCCEGATAADSGIDELVAECAAKLRLAGENQTATQRLTTTSTSLASATSSRFGTGGPTMTSATDELPRYCAGCGREVDR